MELEVEETTVTVIVSVNRKATVMVFTPAMTGIAQAQVKISDPWVVTVTWIILLALKSLTRCLICTKISDFGRQYDNQNLSIV